MSRLGLGLGLTKGGVIPFNPLSLDPYLLFDTQSSMIGTFENPTLDLDPSDPDTLDVITATRAGVATYTDADGLIQSAVQDTVRVDYTQGAELTPTVYQHFGQTNFDDSAWQKITTSITADDALAPDGTATADRMVIPLAANSQSSRLTEESNITSGTTVTISFYVKADGSINPLVLFANGSVYARILFDLQSETSSFVDGALTITHSIEEAENGFYRCSATFTSAGIGSISIRNATAGDGVSSLLLWGPQLEEGTTASDFVANTTGSTKFITGATYGPRVPMILVEPSATNLVTYSEDFSDSDWDNNGSILQNEAVSPDGTQNADLFYSTSTANGRRALEIKTIASGQYYTASVFAKAKNKDFIYFTDIDNQVNSVWFDIKGGTFSTPVEGEALIEDYGNGWFRCSLTTQSSGVNGHCYIGVSDSSGSTLFTTNGTDGVYLWGAQLEAGSVVTSIIPTSGGDAAARTRAADDLEITGSDFDFYNQSEGTFYVESITNKADGQPFIVSADNSADSSEDNVIVIYYSNTTTTTGFVKTGGSTQAVLTIGSRPSAGALSRTSLSYKTNDIEGSVDGGSVASDTSATIPTTINRLSIGTRLTLEDDYKITGHVKRLIFWPYHSDSL